MVRIARRTIERDVTVSNVMAYDIPIPIQSISNRINLAYTHFYSLITKPCYYACLWAPLNISKFLKRSTLV